MANNITPKLKAYVQVDSTGRVVSGTPVFRSSKPKDGNWREIPMYYRGTGGGSTTTTTTAGGGGVTPTAFIKSYFLNTYNACNSTLDGNILFYSSSSTLQAGITVFTDAALTQPVTPGFVIANQIGAAEYVYYLVGQGGVLSNFTCTTTTTTTQGPTLSFIGTGGNSPITACSPGGTSTYYTTGPLAFGIYPQNGITVYFDEALTQPVTLSYIGSPGIGTILDCNNGLLSNERPCQ
jgi:hypothetical protein